jgi:hypothetical protein
MALSSIASADIIVAYSTTFGPTATDITNQLMALTPFSPGASGLTTASDGSWSANFSTSAPGGFTTGVTMASLNSPGVVYTLQSYDILVTQTITGNFSATAGGSGSTGTVGINSYAAISLGSSPGALVAGTDPSADLFNGGVGDNFQGPNPTYSNISANLTSGQSTGLITLNRSNKADFGSFLQGNSPPSNPYTPITIGLGTVKQSTPLDFYLSTLTTVNTSISGGNVTTTKATSVADAVTVVYDFTTSSSSVTPEPTTMVLFGSALVGLGLLRKRARR